MNPTEHTPQPANDNDTGTTSAGNLTDEPTDPDEAAAAAAGEGVGEVGELVWVDPATLIVGANVRGDVALDRHFVRDVAERGVREPIPVRRNADGALVVRKGSRRTMAALEAGLARVRVFIEPAPDPQDGDSAAQIDRVIDQLGENAHRNDNSTQDEVRAHQELLDLGLSAGQIARRTHTPTKRVRATTAVARSPLAAAALARYDLTLDQAAVIAEFDDDTPAGIEAVKALTVCARTTPEQFAHVAQRARDDRTDHAVLAGAVAELTTAGVRVIDADTPGGGGSPLSGLRPRIADPSGTELTQDGHVGCPGHAAQVELRHGWRDDAATVLTTYVCTDPDGHGHGARWYQTPGGSAPAGGGGSGPRPPGPLSDAEKADRRRVIHNNRDWDSAATVRKAWLRTFLSRKAAPRDAARYIASTLARGSHDVRKAMENAHPGACELLGMDPPPSFYSGVPNPIAVATETASGSRLTLLTLAVLLGAAEDATSRDSWRRPSGDTRAYFTALAEWNYPLSPVEQLVCNPDGDTTTPDTDDSAGEDGGGEEVGADPEADDEEPDVDTDVDATDDAA